MSSPSFPSAQEGRALHQRLCERDPVASADLCTAYLDLLGAALRQRNRTVEDHLITTAAEDAVLSLIENPRSYDPSRIALSSYLILAAQGDLRNLLDQERRRRRQIEPISVEDAELHRNTTEDETNPLTRFQREESSAEFDAFLRTASASWNDVEKRFLRAMRDGETASEVFAAILGIAGRPWDEQQAEVKRVKDRLLVRLKRRAEESPSHE